MLTRLLSSGSLRSENKVHSVCIKAHSYTPMQVLYRDLDGSLTGLAGGGWVVPDSPLVPDVLCTPSVSEFSGSSLSYNGTVCSNDVRFLRMAWNQAMPLVRPMHVRMHWPWLFHPGV